MLPDPAAVLDAVGARTLRAATPDEVNPATDYAAGLVSPVGLPPGCTCWPTPPSTRGTVVYCPVGEGGVALGIRAADLLAAVRAGSPPLLAAAAAPGAAPWSGRGRVIDLDAAPPASGPPRR